MIRERESDGVEILVCGAGPAGWVAALQCARLGVRTMLVEKSGMPGGTTTLNRVAVPGIFHAWGRQVIAGIGWEHVLRTLQETDQPVPDFSDIHAAHWKHQVRVDPTVFAALIDESIQSAGVLVRYHTMVAKVDRRDDGWLVTLCGKEGLHTVAARWLIDTTGDANLAGLAGVELRRFPTLQPGTLVFKLDGYDPSAIDMEALDAAAHVALSEGRLDKGDFGWNGTSLRGLVHSRGENAIHVTGIDATDSAGKSDAEQRGRAAALRVFRFFKSQHGFDKLHFTWSAPECGIRDTRTIVGRATVNYDDYVTGRLWDDAVCHSFYPIDLHTDHGLKYEKLREGVVPSIPLGAMQPVGVERLLVAGRCISADQSAHSALRVQASCMAMGQAAGAAAAYGVRESEPIKLESIRSTLRQHGAIVPGSR